MCITITKMEQKSWKNDEKKLNFKLKFQKMFKIFNEKVIFMGMNFLPGFRA